MVLCAGTGTGTGITGIETRKGCQKMQTKHQRMPENHCKAERRKCHQRAVNLPAKVIKIMICHHINRENKTMDQKQKYPFYLLEKKKIICKFTTVAFCNNDAYKK